MKKIIVVLILTLFLSSCKTSVLFYEKNELSPFADCYGFNSSNIDEVIRKFKLNKYDFYIREDSVIKENNCKYGLFYLTTLDYKRKDYIKDKGHPPLMSNLYSLEIPLIILKDTFFINENKLCDFFGIKRNATMNLNIKLLKSKLNKHFGDSINTIDFILAEFRKGVKVNYLTPNYVM